MGTIPHTLRWLAPLPVRTLETSHPLAKEGLEPNSSGASVQQGTCDIGLIGLAVMGQNLVLNMNDHGYKVALSVS